MSESMRNVKPSAGCSRSNAAHDEVAAVARDRQLGLDRELAGLHHLHLEVECERRREHVEAGAEVGRGGGDADEAAADHGR